MSATHVALYDSNRRALYSFAVLDGETPSSAVTRVRGGASERLRELIARADRVDLLTHDPREKMGWRHEVRPDLLDLLKGGQTLPLTLDGGI